jgi:tripartite motif-containing protein 71
MAGAMRRGRLVRLAVSVVLALPAVAFMPVPASAASATFSGHLDSSGTSWRAHKVHLNALGTIDAKLDWNDAAANLNLFLYDPDGALVARANSKTAKPERVTHAAGTKGQWRLGVKAKTGAADYALTVTYPSAAAAQEPTLVDTIGGGTAGHAPMYPSGVDVDQSGNVYVADTGDDEIQSYGPGGGFRWERGSRGPKAPGRFENPRDVAFLNGKVYVADTGYNRVQVLNASDGTVDSVWSVRFGTIMGISAGVGGGGADLIFVSESSANTIRVYRPDGSLVRSVGSGPGSGAGQLSGPRDAATDASGNIYVADYANSRVAVFQPNGTWIGAWGVNGTSPGQFKRPYGIDLDQRGDVYVADSNNYIHRFDVSLSGGSVQAAFVRAYGSPGETAGKFSMLRRVAVGSGTDPKIYGADLWRYKIEIFGQVGAHLGTLGGTEPATGFFNEPYGVAVDGTNVFVTDMVNQRIQRFSSDSPYGFQTAWGQRGWGEGNPGFNWPKGITLSTNAGARTVWVADTKNNRLSEFSPSGTPTGRKFGKVGAAVGQLRWPFGVASYGTKLVVADTNNHRIQLWDPAGPNVVWTSTGASGKPYSKPKAVAVAARRVYVADTQNDRIVVLDADTATVLDVFTSDTLRSTDGVAVEPNGDVWVSDSRRNRLVEFTADGTLLQTFGSAGSGPKQLNKPLHLATLTTGTGAVYLFVVDSWNDRVQVFEIG